MDNIEVTDSQSNDRNAVQNAAKSSLRAMLGGYVHGHTRRQVFERQGRRQVFERQGQAETADVEEILHHNEILQDSFQGTDLENVHKK